MSSVWIIVLIVVTAGLLVWSSVDIYLCIRRDRQVDKEQKEEERVAKAAETVAESIVITALLQQTKTLVSANLALMAENEGVKAMVARELARNHEPPEPVVEGLNDNPEEDEAEAGQFEGAQWTANMGAE